MSVGEKKRRKKKLHYSSLVLFDKSPARLVVQRTINLFSILNSWIHAVMVQSSWILGPIHFSLPECISVCALSVSVFLCINRMRTLCRFLCFFLRVGCFWSCIEILESRSTECSSQGNLDEPTCLTFLRLVFPNHDHMSLLHIAVHVSLLMRILTG